jgi:hypothetical protein
MSKLSNLSDIWMRLKEAERKATEERREIEDAIINLLGIDESLDGTKNFAENNFEIKVVGRMNRRVDTDLLQELAEEHGLTEHLSSMFRWKAEINSAVWKAADKSLTEPLLGAITTTPGRPSFTITTKE